MKNKIIHLGLVGLFILAIVSCKKDKTDESKLLENAEAEATANAFFDDIYNEMEETIVTLENNGYEPQGNKSGLDEGSRIITVSQGQGTSSYPNFPRLITISYTNWTSPSGKVKNGIVYIHITAPYRVEGSIKTITFENFSIDDHQIEGTKVIENIGNRSYTITISDGKITFPDGTIYTREANRTRTWVEGFDTPNIILDDEYEITGTSSGINRKEYSYTHTIATPLRIRMACLWIVSGTINLLVDDITAVLDYGDGECDNKATFIVNDTVYNITLRGHHNQ